MGTNLAFSLSLAYAGGLAAVGATASAVLIFQLTCGVVQRTLAEASLLATASDQRRAEPMTCRWSIAIALAAGLLGGVVAVAATIAVPGVSPRLAMAYALGIPFALALDIGRAADVARGDARAAVLETSAWLTSQLVLMGMFAALRAPMGICLSCAASNGLFFVLAMIRRHRAPAFRGAVSWLRSRGSLLGAASLDALLVGLTPVLAMQITAYLTTSETIGAVRVLQQVLAPLAFVSITLRRVLIYRRTSDAPASRTQETRDGLIAMGLMAAGGALIGAALVLGRHLVPALAFIPVGWVLVAAGGEKAALGFSYGCSLSKFVRGEFGGLLRARYLMVALAVIAAPLATLRWGAVGYLIGSSVAMVGYSFVVLATSTHRATGHRLLTSPVRASSGATPGDQT
jgi:hypothetical protein